MDWQPPTELPDLRRVGIIAIDTETKDDRLRAGKGSGWPTNEGSICGVGVAHRADGDIRAHYFPLRHPDSNNFDPAQLYQWLRDLIASTVRIVTQNGPYDWGWLRTEANIKMPPAERLEEIGALATIVDENRFNYGLDALCAWHILDHVVNGRIHAEIHPHRSDAGGTRSLRFSYSKPPLQLMSAHDEEIAPLIRGVFLPEEGEVWAKPDISQQEFRFIVHYAAELKLPRAQEAVDRYRDDRAVDFHDMVAEWTDIARQQAKNTNYAKAFGAGVRKFATMIGKSEAEAQAIYARYDRELPFVTALAKHCEKQAKRFGYLELYDGARRHWSDWVAWADWTKGAGPCPREEAERRIKDPKHPWYRRGPLRRTDTHKALNALIQGSAARHTKLWMRAVWRAEIVPLLQMHDSLDCSVTSREQAELIARLGEEAVALQVPMRVDLKFGRNWGDAKHSWEELPEARRSRVCQPH